MSAVGELLSFRHQAGQACNCFGVNCAPSSRRLDHSSRRQSRASKIAEAGDAQHAAVDPARRGESRDRRELLGNRLHQSKSERTGPRTAEEIRQAYGRPRQNRSTSTSPSAPPALSGRENSQYHGNGSALCSRMHGSDCACKDSDRHQCAGLIQQQGLHWKIAQC